MYKLFCCYRREDIYQNDNYISDGLEDQEVIDRAKEFIEVAKKELVKSSTMQHSISTTLYNLLCIPEFKPILNSFEVGNWIRVRVDENIYKLRLIQYEISFSNINTISVEFSDVTKIRDSLTDFQSLVKDTQSMSSSYSYISKQADAGQKASESMNNVLQNGLNSALVSIKNNDKEEVTYDKHGILCREYDDISDSYSDEQLIITHNILGYTDNGMKSVKASLGKHEYVYYNGSTFVKDIAYGLSCEFVQSGYIYGSQIISGDIYSSNYSSTAGSHINLKDGSFSFAGGKFSYDSKSNNMILKGVTIKWDSSTPPEITDIDGLNEQLSGIDDYLNQLDGRIQSFSQITDPSTNWITVSLKEQHIGDLWFNPNNGLTKRWTGSSWETITDSILESLAKSKAQVFTAKPTVVYFKGDMLIPVETFDFNGVKYIKEKAYRALKDSNGTTFSNSDWDALDYTNDDAIVAFINGDYADDVKKIRNQIDGKARAWYQSDDPSLSWDKSEDHEGDLWYNTSATSQVTYIYKDGKWKETNVPKAVFDTIDGKRQIFVKKPTSPYMTGDLWIISKSDCTNGKITVNGVTYNANSTLIAVLPSGVTERTTFTASDWTDISTQDGIVALDQSTQALNKFDDIANDGKITPTEKQQIKSLFENITADKMKTDSQCSQYGINSSGSVYYSDYTNFNNAFTTLKNLISNSILNDMTTTISVPNNYSSVLSDYYSKQNTIIADIEKASKGYAESVLSNFVNGAYKTALENISTQIDGKADTFYQSTMPHPEYTNVESNNKYDLCVGDLWYNPNTGKSQMYQKTANGSNFDYTWKFMNVPQDVYDKIDGIASIYVTLPSNPNVGDLLIPNSDISGTSYKAGKVYKYNGSSWIEIKYTDDTALDAYKKDNKAFQEKVNKALTGSTNEIGEDYIISPKIGGGYLYIKNKSDKRSVTIDPQQTYSSSGYIFKITDKNGNVTIGADSNGNAEFTGTIYATNGYFSGKITSTSGSIGGWIIDSDCLKTDDGKVKLLNDGTISGAKITGASGEFTQSFNVDCYQLTGYVDNIHHINTWLNTRNTIGIDAEGTYVGMQGEDDDNNLIENFIYLQPNVLTIKSFYTNAETGEHVCKENQGYISLEATRALVFNVLGDNNDGINFHGGDVYIQKGLNVNGEDGNVLLNCALDVYGRASLLNSTTTHMIAPEVNATYSLGDYSNKIGWSNIYLGNADNTWNGLRIFVGTEARVMCGINADGYMTFGNTASTMYYNCKSIGALSSGVDEAFRISPGAYTADYNTDNVYLFGRRDSRSKFIGSYLVYARTYGSAANVVVTENGVLGRSTSSSKRYKHDIREFSVDEISCLYDLPLKKFKYNNDYISKDDEYYDKDLYGFIVEDLNEVLPISVQHNLDDNGKHTIPEMWNNNIIVPCLLKLIQDLNNRLKKVEEK